MSRYHPVIRGNWAEEKLKWPGDEIGCGEKEVAATSQKVQIVPIDGSRVIPNDAEQIDAGYAKCEMPVAPSLWCLCSAQNSPHHGA